MFRPKENENSAMEMVHCKTITPLTSLFSGGKDPQSTIMIELIGYITGRRCCGKNLTFADIQVEEAKTVTANDDNENSYTLSEENKTTTSTMMTIEDGKEEFSIGASIKVVFQRSSEAWAKHNNSTDDNDDKTTNNVSDEFPSKNSKLPHGAKIKLYLAMTEQEGKTDEFENYDICYWQLLENPKEKALEVAKNAVAGNGGGISCQKYLKERHDAYSKFNDANSQKHLKKTSSASAIGDKSTRPQKQQKTSNNTSNIVEQQFSHGNNKAKSKRAKIFATWLIEELGVSFLCRGIGVLDVAGGKGNLSIELSLQGKIPCTIIDPLVRKHGSKLSPAIAKRIRKANAPHPNLISKEFNQDSFINENSQEQQREEGNAGSSETKDGDDTSTAARTGEQTIKESSICVGLHPDQATEDILDLALKYNKSVAIVPCCVFAELFPNRFLPPSEVIVDDSKRGKKTQVRTYEEFIQYLLSKDSRLKLHTLPFEGRNQVVYLFDK